MVETKSKKQKEGGMQTSGKRKTAIARVSLKAGTGQIKINGVELSNYEPELARLRIKEPLILAESLADKVDARINVAGGGVMGQADAIRTALGAALVKFFKDEKLKKKFHEYDRTLLVSDTRRKETAKPNSHGTARAKRQKSYR